MHEQKSEVVWLGECEGHSGEKWWPCIGGGMQVWVWRGVMCGHWWVEWVGVDHPQRMCYHGGSATLPSFSYPPHQRKPNFLDYTSCCIFKPYPACLASPAHTFLILL